MAIGSISVILDAKEDAFLSIGLRDGTYKKSSKKQMRDYEFISMMLEKQDPDLKKFFVRHADNVLQNKRLTAADKKALQVFLKALKESSEVDFFVKKAIYAFFKPGLSESAKVGIGMVGVAATAAIIAGACLITRLRRTRNRSSEELCPEPSLTVLPSLDHPSIKEPEERDDLSLGLSSLTIPPFSNTQTIKEPERIVRFSDETPMSPGLAVFLMRCQTLKTPGGKSLSVNEFFTLLASLENVTDEDFICFNISAGGYIQDACLTSQSGSVLISFNTRLTGTSCRVTSIASSYKGEHTYKLSVNDIKKFLDDPSDIRDLQEQCMKQEISFPLQLSMLGKFVNYVGCSEIQGKRPEMEDACVAHYNSELNIGIFGVFDGHGGDYVAKILAEKFSLFVFDKVALGADLMNDSVIQKLWIEFDASLKDANVPSGSTAVVALFLADGSIKLVNLGDSRVIVLDNNCIVIAQSLDHKPSCEHEQARIALITSGLIATGGGGDTTRRIEGLSVSRSFGDFRAKNDTKSRSITLADGTGVTDYPVSNIPDIITLSADTKMQYVVLACDGVWDVLSSEQVADIVRLQKGEAQTCQQIARAITMAAFERRSRDNISTMVIDITPHASTR
jgi:serine/threonine protein phosphatase PrpC